MKFKNSLAAILAAACILFAQDARAGGWYRPTVPILPQAEIAPPAQVFIPTVPVVQRSEFQPTVPTLQRPDRAPANYVALPAEEFYPQVAQIAQAPTLPQYDRAPKAQFIIPIVPRLPDAELYVDP